MQAHTLTRFTAKRLVDNGARYAIERNLPVVIAVVDQSGHLVVLERLNGTQPGAVEVAVGKAQTAAIFRRRTQVLEQSVSAGRFALLSLSNMTPVEGGLPVVWTDFVIGGIGVSGVKSVDDEKVALAAFADVAVAGHPLSFEPPAPRIFPEETGRA